MLLFKLLFKEKIMSNCSSAVKAHGALTVIVPTLAFGLTCLAAHLLKVAIVVSGVFAAAPALLSMASGYLFFVLASQNILSSKWARAGNFIVSLLITATAIAIGVLFGHIGVGISAIIAVVGLISAFCGPETIHLFAKQESFLS